MTTHKHLSNLGVFLTLFVILLSTVFLGQAEAKSSKTLRKGKSYIMFDGWAGPKLKVWTYKPKIITPDTPIIFVMHGASRTAENYRNKWADLAKDNKFILVVPEFSKKKFPNSRTYNLGHIYDENGNKRPKELWSFSAIEPLFDDIKRRTNNNQTGYGIFGHSAGGQFVHRYVFFMPEARITTAIAANPGWYTMPNKEEQFPYGFKGTYISQADIQAGYAKNLIVLLGTQDIKTKSSNLRKTPEAMKQGPHRFARGKHYFTHAKASAKASGVPFNWRLIYAPDVGHSNTQIAPYAAPIFGDISKVKMQKKIKLTHGVDPTGEHISILFLGDTSHGDNYQESYARKGQGNILIEKGYEYTLAKLSPLLKASDYVVVNVETPLTNLKTSPNSEKTPLHWSDPKRAAASYKNNNFSVVSLANNHAMDYGSKGLEDTLLALKSQNISSFGAGLSETSANSPHVKTFDLGSCKIDMAIFGRFDYRKSYDEKYDFYAKGNNPGAARFDAKSLAKDIRVLKAKNPNMLTIVFPHWGQNYVWKNKQQIEKANILARAGVDLIIGHGAHTAGEIEQIRDTLVMYSIGNFAFNSGGRFGRKPDVLPMSLMARLIITKDNKPETIRLYPIYSDNKVTKFQPRFVSNQEFTRAVNTIEMRSNNTVKFGTAKDKFGPYLEVPVKTVNCR